MLLDFHKLVIKHNLKIKGVVHAGAHHGEEVQDYRRYTQKLVLIEPCSNAYKILKSKFTNATVPVLYNVALGASETTMQMNIETANKGQSNSLLKPVEHLTQYPDIVFAPETETVKVNKLDNLAFDRNQFNLLVMDIQGYELEALKGATWTLDHIDYIYTEVNKTEVYEGCAKVGELDEFLKKWSFVRVETSAWVNNSWGDALYVKKKSNPAAAIGMTRQLANNFQFKPEQKHIYPDDNKPYFEKWYSDNRSPVDGWTYLDVLWTAYYVNNNRHGKIDTRELQRYLNTLDKSKKYYTVVQYDDGILNDVKHLDLRVYAMSGKRIDYPLPLICQPHPYKFDFERNILANFIGKETHPIRKEILKLKGQPQLYISKNQHTLESFCHVLSTSVFTLCPRGYGQTSFRICEALQYGSIPVYISDEFIKPHNADFNYGLIVDKSMELNKLLDLLHNMDENEVRLLYHYARIAYERYFTFEANKKLIEEDLKKQP